MSEQDRADAIRELQAQRAQGLLTPREAYERHLELLGPAEGAAVASAGPPAIEERRVEDTAASSSAAAAPLTPAYHARAVAMAMLGGLLGVVGAFLSELQGALQGGVLFVILGAPVIEEALKPAGIYLLLLRWPRAVAGQLHTALLCALSGCCFGLVESLVYVYVYFPDQGGDFALFRFTVPVAMHAGASFLVGLGLSRAVIDWAAGRGPIPRRTRAFYISAVVLHAAYNLLAVVLSLAGLVDFGD